jgi:hypothetical protein
MKIIEVDNSMGPPAPTPDPDQLAGLVQFLAGRATDVNAKKEISQDAFLKLAQDLDININPQNLADIVSQPPLSNLLEPMDPNTGVLVFKGAGEPNPAMPVNKAQDIVAAAAKKAASKDRGI